VEIRGTSADHPRHQHLSEGTGCTESCPLPLSYSTPQQHLRIRFLCSRLFHSPDLETHHNQSAPPSYYLHPLPNQSPKPPGNITGIISPGLWAPAHQWSSHPAIPCEAPATRKLKTHPNAACSKNIFISQPLHTYTTSTTRRFLDPTKHHIAAHRVTDVCVRVCGILSHRHFRSRYVRFTPSNLEQAQFGEPPGTWIRFARVDCSRTVC
jgi:hypothetical protein